MFPCQYPVFIKQYAQDGTKVSMVLVEPLTAIQGALDTITFQLSRAGTHYGLHIIQPVKFGPHSLMILGIITFVVHFQHYTKKGSYLNKTFLTDKTNMSYIYTI